MNNRVKRIVTEQSDNKNPFVYDGPVTKNGLLLKRHHALGWVQENLENSINLPLVIEGEPGIGKSTFLLNVTEFGDKLGFVSLYVDLAMIPLNSFTDFLWALGKAISLEISKQSIEPPVLEKRMLIVRPWQAFQSRFWQRLPVNIGNKKMLLVLDNFDSLVGEVSSPESNRVYRQYLFDLLDEGTDVYTVMSVTGRLSAFGPNELVPFNRLLSNELPLFSEDQTHELLRSNGVLDFSPDVSLYIHSLTMGHPSDIQRLCHAVYERFQVCNYRLVTAADIVATIRFDMSPGKFRRSTYKNRARVSYIPQRQSD